jgi:hypothetical protein
LRLGQVISNLVGNAIKFTPYGGVHVSLHGRVLEARGALLLRVEVHDTGIGLEPAHMQRMFEPFEQADSTTTRRYGGTGLGLSISRQLVELMEGHIGVQSKPGEGSTFWFTCVLGLPAEPPSPEALPAPAIADPSPMLPAASAAQPVAALRPPTASELSGLRAMIYTLQDMLDRRQVRARQLSADIERGMGGTALAPGFAPIARHIASLRFDVALILLREMTSQPPWETE